MMSWKKQGVQILAITSIFGFAIFAAGCGSNNSSNAATSLIASTLTISPSSTSLSENSDLQFTASGGNPPYNFSVVSPGSPTGGEINASTGLYMAPSYDETVQIMVTDSTGDVSYATIIVGSGSTGGVGTGTTTGTIVCNSISQCTSALSLQYPIDGSSNNGYENAQVACQILGYSSVASYTPAYQYIDCGNNYTLSEADGSSFTSVNEQICYNHDPYAYAIEISQIQCN
jgi:hypothetical protein